MKITAEPRSDQWNGDDFIGGKSRVFTIKDVKVGAAEQKYDIELVEGEGRVWRPPITVVRILIDAWGDESDDWIGKRVALYREPSVTFGREKTGGIRISHMSDLADGKPLHHNSTVSRGRKQIVVIQPLPDAPSKIPVSFDAKIPTSTLDQCAQARDYLAKYADTEPERVAALLDKVTARETELAQEVTE